MGNDFMDLLSGDQPEKKDSGEKGAAGDLLGSLLGGGGGGDLGSLLGGLMGGGGAAPAQPPASGAGDLGALLGGLMGGGGAAPAQPEPSGMGGLLGSLLGGAASSPAGSAGMGGLLGGLLGAGGVSLPFANVLAEKLGISEQMANMLIMGALGLLTSSAAKKKTGDRSVGIDALADPDFIRSSGVPSQLSEQMGISEDEAIGHLQQTLGLMAAAGEQAASEESAAPAKEAKPKKPASKSTKTASKKKPAK